MASFHPEGYYNEMWNCRELSAHVDGIDARGGASLATVGNMIVLFGGADRGQCSFGDLWVCSNNETFEWRKVECTGDAPTPRSGHAVTSVDNIMFLFGGIDFSEEAVYNDLYILNTDTWEWSYVGEAGEEVVARNSHSLGIVSSSALESGCEAQRYLVVYGGASPELGPLGDTYYAELPGSFADLPNLYVTWKKLPDYSVDSEDGPSNLSGPVPGPYAGPGPGTREMHCTCCHLGRMYINGGRNEVGEVLSDTWALVAASRPPSSSPPSQPVEGTTSPTPTPSLSPDHPPLVWRSLPELTLAAGRCSHGGAVLSWVDSEYGADQHLLCVFGGFCGEAGVSGDLSVTLLPTSLSIEMTETSEKGQAIQKDRWRTAKTSKRIPERFGLSLCTAPHWMTTTTPLPSTTTTAGARGRGVADSTPTSGAGASAYCSVGEAKLDVGCVCVGLVVFGGINIETDLNDFWLLSLQIAA